MEQRMSYRVPDEFIIQRQGKKMVLYGGLLDAAHAQGLKSIETDIEQIPSPDNGNVAIVTAVVQMEEDPDREADTIVHRPPKLFSGIGDASPDNVGRNIAPHLIRMAETRAKSRALRDAVDIGGLMIADDETEAASPQALAPAPAPTLPEHLASREQQGYLKGLIEQLGMENGRAHFEVKHGAISTFSPEKATHWIDHFKSLIGAMENLEEE